MGAVYSIETNISYKDKKAVGIKVAKKLNLPVDTPLEEGFKKLFPNWNGLCEDNFACGNADFDASYGWESLMQEVFSTIAPLLGAGSKLMIAPDNDSYEGIVVGEKVEWRD